MGRPCCFTTAAAAAESGSACEAARLIHTASEPPCAWFMRTDSDPHGSCGSARVIGPSTVAVLGLRTEPEGIEVRWPDGVVQRVDVTNDQLGITVVRANR